MLKYTNLILPEHDDDDDDDDDKIVIYLLFLDVNLFPHIKELLQNGPKEDI